jgi:hypothetical protein
VRAVQTVKQVDIWGRASCPLLVSIGVASIPIALFI